jgi:FKBP-type peptidyl-prolyl cis-trans isomerase FkpA
MSRLLPLILAAATLTAACGGDDTPTSPSANVPFTRTDLRLGTGTEATAGRTVVVNYGGWLYSANAAENKGSLFDSGQYSFVLGTGNAIAGWHQGLTGMRVGGQRRLIIPPELGYGPQGRPPAIPGNSTLVFDVELVSVQ